MKRLLLFTILLVTGSIIYAQSLVSTTSLNFVRPQGSIGAFSSINISVNNLNIGQIENGSTFSHKLSISARSSVTVKATSSIYSREISFDVEPGQSYSFELGFLEQGIFMLAIDQLAFNRHIQNIQSATSTTSTQQGAALVPSQGGSQATFVAPGAKVQEQPTTTQPTTTQPTTTQPTTTQPTTTQTSANQLITQALKDKQINYEYEKELDSEAIRKEWLLKGGQLTGTSFVGGLSVLYKEDENFALNGAGLNVAYNQNLFNLKIPEYTTGPSSWSSFHFGYGLAGSYNTSTIEFYYSEFDLDPIESTSYQLDLNINVGLTLGLGRFIDKANWRGAAIELNYRPTYSTFIPEEGDPQSNFNFSGFSFDINGSNFTSSMNKIAPKAQMKFSLFILPPVKDLPLFVSINIGALWYSK